jgi:hypothetical protein
MGIRSHFHGGRLLSLSNFSISFIIPVLLWASSAFALDDKWTADSTDGFSSSLMVLSIYYASLEISADGCFSTGMLLLCLRPGNTIPSDEFFG